VGGIVKDYSLSARWGLAFAICFIAPFCEEVIFRGFLLNAFLRWGALPGSRVSW
jgi:membrane protease YdiL (CAAX protease family)